MPGFFTHYLGGQAALAQLPDEITAIVKGSRQRIFTLGTQGPDIFFYYAPGFMRKRTNGIGSEIHRGKYNAFFLQMARLLKGEKNQERREILFAYLAGFLLHYTVDTHAHPFVLARVWRADATPVQESAEHRHLETSIDTLMLARLTGEKPGDYRHWSLIDAQGKHKRIAAAAFGTAASKVYQRDIRPQDVYHAMGYMIALTRALQSEKGRRKHFAAFFEDRIVKARILSAMVHQQQITDAHDYLNLSRAHWGESNASFPELFDNAVAEGCTLIKALYAYMHGETDRGALAKLIGNRSLSTGESL
ncbi:MAG: zinc dependent phospholipase C family protein [Defluviitaleaceae bacterium]|nr:zinc dependent phospholipase C family protein [Defluviitaleaceae bacterium]MCL2238860.1 zinc dependent phospholipase C family protein [Defluviitaleaceae bacterium]